MRVPKRVLAHWDSYRHGQNHRPETRALRSAEFAKYQELTGLLYRAGVPLLAGTDSAEPYCPPGWALHQELQLLVESGLSPGDALRAATWFNAHVLRQQQHLGSIEAGKLADLVILDADPMLDIRNTRRIHAVVRGGQVCDLDAALRSVPTE